jgi:dihydroneopterin aldolase
MTGTITLKGIRCYAYHGCMEEERKIGGEYVVDVALQAELFTAVSGDRLKDTIDYCEVERIVSREMQQPSRLIEHACGRILLALKRELPRIAKVKVRVTKLNPPMQGDVREVSVLLQG